MHDYRKTLALIAPGIMAGDADVWMSEGCFEWLRWTLEQVTALEVEFELQKAVETRDGLDLHYRAYGTGAAKMQVDRLMAQQYKN
ncbi:hypothetical protein [Rhizobium sp. Leaf391]|uniref:hypothetical protein n=1 Tax=Rhizobium sp. Leaf391 TaxID=1736360 RepID=UPI000AA35D08|nr:hypothetical protein [Rhizobium sp. Leaf391]